MRKQLVPYFDKHITIQGQFERNGRDRTGKVTLLLKAPILDDGTQIGDHLWVVPVHRTLHIPKGAVVKVNGRVRPYQRLFRKELTAYDLCLTEVQVLEITAI